MPGFSFSFCFVWPWLKVASISNSLEPGPSFGRSCTVNYSPRGLLEDFLLSGSGKAMWGNDMESLCTKLVVNVGGP